MCVEVADEGQFGGSRVAGEPVLEGGNVCVLKCREELISEGSINVITFVVLSTLFGVLAEERLLIEGVFPHQGVGCATGVGQADEWVLGDKGVMSLFQDDPKVAYLALAVKTLD